MSIHKIALKVYGKPVSVALMQWNFVIPAETVQVTWFIPVHY